MSTLAKAVELHQAGQLAAAETLYREVLAVEPEIASAHHMALQTGRDDEACRWIHRAMELDSKVAVFHSNLAAVSLRAKPASDVRVKIGH